MGKRRPATDVTARWITSWSGFAYATMTEGTPQEKRDLLGESGSTEEALAALTVSWAVEWTRSARATVNVPSRLAASLACSSSEPGDLRMPYGPGLLVRIGPGVLKSGDRDFQYIMLHAIGEPFLSSPRWCLQLTSADADDRMLQKAALHKDLTLAEFLGDSTPLADSLVMGDQGFEVPQGSDARVILAAQSVIRGVLLLLTAERLGTTDSVRTSSPRRVHTDDIQALEFDLVAEVNLDLRARVASFCSGHSGHKLEVRHLVRGHFKRQHSKAGEDIIWIQPYWRGPVDGPLAARSVTISEDTAHAH